MVFVTQILLGEINSYRKVKKLKLALLTNCKIIRQIRPFFKIFHFFVWIIKKPVLPLPRLQSSYAGILILSMNGFFIIIHEHFTIEAIYLTVT